jgi:dGTPase
VFDFTKKITSERVTDTKQYQPDNLLFAFESDRGRIINSAAVRRLQQKTQVFPLERNSAVRSRLTHSLEVQQVGRFIVQKIFNTLDKKQLEAYKLDGLERCLESVVEMSCLLHDVGNPPFGHFGEQSINDWFEHNFESMLPTTKENNLDKKLTLSDELKRDICHFEGNAQAIRLIHSLLQLNLTYCQVAGILKYTRCGTDVKPEKTDKFSYLKKKVGYYHSEKAYVENLCKSLDMQVGCRHPVSYIMEAADDISYCIADIEDAVEKDILDVEKLCVVLLEESKSILGKFGLNEQDQTFEKIINKALKKYKEDGMCQVSEFFVSLRVGALHPLAEHATKRFVSNINDIYAGSFNEALLEDESTAHAISETLKQVAFKYVFCDKEVESRELQGYKIISGLLDVYKPLLSLNRTGFEAVKRQDISARLFDKRLFKKLPNKHLRAYDAVINENSSDEDEFYYRCRLFQDYISGMTDQFAYDEYRALMISD